VLRGGIGDTLQEGLRSLICAGEVVDVQVLDTAESLLQPWYHVADVADSAGTVRIMLALPSWDDSLHTDLDDLIESASRFPMVLLRARILLTAC
jgi:hypothetical protein